MIIQIKMKKNGNNDHINQGLNLNTQDNETDKNDDHTNQGFNPNTQENETAKVVKNENNEEE